MRMDMLSAMATRSERFAAYLKTLTAVQRLKEARERLPQAQTLTHANICLAEQVEDSDALLRLRNHRDKEIAHAILWTVREKRDGPVALAQSSDADALLQSTVEIMSTVAAVAQLTYQDFRDELAQERATAEAFFEGLGPALRAGARQSP